MKFRIMFVLGMVAALSLAVNRAAAQSAITVEQLTEFVKSSIQMKHNDRQVAEYIRKSIKLSDKLDASTVEDLQGLGAGPQTVLALRSLMTASASLSAAPPPPPKPVYVGPPAPSPVEQKEILEKIRENALNYTQNLPNFICLQVTTRYISRNGNTDDFHQMDVIGERLSYVDQKEEYKVVQRNHIPVTDLKHDQLGGATSSGEFGTMLKEIFTPETETSFDWDHWATLRQRRAYVFSFRVRQANSKYSIYHQESGRTVIAGYRGLIYADRKTNMVMRIKMESEDLPPDFAIQDVSLDLNYDNQTISGQQFWLPLKSELRSREGRYLVKNDTEFRLYNKFSAESTIDFGAASTDPLPDDTTKETPAK